MSRSPVVVVGAGPAGLATAITLARAGVEVLLVERRASGSPLPRATVLSLRSMELLRSWGLEDRIHAGADDVDMTMLAMPSAVCADQGEVIDVGYPTRAQSAMLSPTRAVCVAQDHLESELLELLSGYSTITIERGCEVFEVVVADGSVLVTVRDAAGRVRMIEADYVVGADGARSVVRASAGIVLEGPDDLHLGVRVEFHAPLWEVLAKHRHLIYAITDPEASGVLLPAGRGDRWIFALSYGDTNNESVGRPTNAALVQRLLKATGLPGSKVRTTRFDTFSAGAQLADRFSRDRLFLVGDAAHRVTPRGGTGLNIALADGHNLGWKLGWVLRGWASTSLLASYETERRPIARHNVARSADPAGASRPAASETHVDLGGRLSHRWVAPGRSTLDLLGEGLTLLGTDAALGSHTTTGSGSTAPLDAVPLDALTAQSLGLGSRGAVLVRPDGLPLAAWSAPPTPELVADATATLFAGPTGQSTDEISPAAHRLAARRSALSP